MSFNLRVKGNITTNVGGTTRIYAKEGVEINSRGFITYSAPEYTYGDPEDPPELQLKPKKIKFRPLKLSISQNIIAVIEQIDNKFEDGDKVLIRNGEITDNWVSLQGKLYLIPKDFSFFGTTLFKINDNIYQSVDQITNCKSLDDYINSFEEQMQILKEFIKDIQSSKLKYKDQIKDRLSYDAYFRFIECIHEIESLFSESSDYENAKKWINKKFQI